MWVIYKHTNKINGKIYIGQTSQDPKKRWNYGYGYIDCPKFYAAIQKYGWNNFEHEIIEKNILTIEEADIREIYWIEYYNSVQNGYNINKSAGHHARGIELSKAISEGQKKNWANNPDRKEKASQKFKEQWKNDEYRNKFLGANNGNSKKIICIETNQIFNTLKEAAEWANTSRQNITGVLKNRQKTAAGYHWKYYKEETED